MNSASMLQHWNPEDRSVWEHGGRAMATRNLWISIPALALAFAVWMLWSVVVVYLPAAGFRYSTNQLFWLTALPALCGATLRVFYAFVVPLVGGRRFTAWATASLLLPAVGMGLAVQNPHTPYEWMLVLALLCGLGGANFSSSMAHISFFFPTARKGVALGLNAGLGHLGVAVVQFVVPAVIGVSIFGAWGGVAQSTEPPMWLQNAGFVWVPLIVASAMAAWWGMDDLTPAPTGFAEQAVIFTREHNWWMCWLYVGTFGSFIGFSAALPMLIQSQFAAPALLQLAWVGPLIGAVTRPVGGWLADRWGGARITWWSFFVMAVAILGVLWCLPQAALGEGAHATGNLAGFLAAFALLFAAAGLGNGSTFRMIPLIFAALRQSQAEPLLEAQALATREGEVEAAAVLGFVSAMGAYGGFFIPKSFGTAISLTGSPTWALYLFFVFYLSCMALTWWQYSRPGAPMPC